MYPWSDVISDNDLLSFRSGLNGMERSLETGVKPALIIVDMTWAFVDSRYPTGWSETGYPAVTANRNVSTIMRHFS